MTAIRYAADLVEESIFLWMTRAAGSAEAALWQAQRDDLYGAAGGREREASFQTLARSWFARLALGRPIEAALESCPRVRAALEAIDVRRVLRARQEGSEAFGSEDLAGGGPRTLVLGTLPNRLLDPVALGELALRELLYVDDMLDPRFGFDPRLAQPDGDPARKDLVRDRFNVLWRARIEGRRHRCRGSGAAPPAADSRFRAAFRSESDARKVDDLFYAAWSGSLSSFSELMECASSGEHAPQQERGERCLGVLECR